MRDTGSIPEFVLSNLDRPHRVNISGVWELPIGKDKALLRGSPRWLDGVVGGWQTQAIFTWQVGLPLALGNVIFTCSSYDQLNQVPGGKSINQWFNTGCFQRANTTPTSTLFGAITGTQSAEGERRVFVGAKVIF